jgi:hypothetical protein
MVGSRVAEFQRRSNLPCVLATQAAMTCTRGSSGRAARAFASGLVRVGDTVGVPQEVDAAAQRLGIQLVEPQRLLGGVQRVVVLVRRCPIFRAVLSPWALRSRIDFLRLGRKYAEAEDAAHVALELMPHPERFRSHPVTPKLPGKVWINKPRPTIMTQEATQINQAA